MLRDGIEDYEYLAILSRLIEAKGRKLSASQRASYAALLEVPAEITKDMTTFTTDPAPIERHRHRVALAIAELSRIE
jgi:tryptophanyl-tRNA synthetase